MAYLKLDGTNIKYRNTEPPRGGIILSEVIESSCAPEDPVLITTQEDLDIFFGNSFEDREYYDELLHSGASLLLTKPIKSEIYETPEIDTSRYQVVDYIEIDVEIQVRNGTIIEKKRIPIDWEDQLPIPGESETKYYVTTTGEYYIWVPETESYVKESQIPVSPKYSSLLNRDTLRLNCASWTDYDGISGFPWCYPKYETRDYTPEYQETLTDPKSLLQSIESHGLSDDTRSIGFILDFSGVKEIKDTDYIVFPVDSSKGHKLGKMEFGGRNPLTSDVITGEKGKLITNPDRIQGIIDALQEDEFGYSVYQVSPGIYKIYTTDMVRDLRFYNIEGLRFEPDLETTHNILSILSQEHRRMEFYSKTLGKGDDDIRVKIDKLQGKTEWYRVIISRFTYQEVFEGPLYIEKSETSDSFISLEKLINFGSRIVEVKVFNEGKDKNDPSHGLPTGEFKLSRSKEETKFTPEDYWRGLKKLQDYDISEDFLMIPKIEKYIIHGATKDSGWIIEYEDLLDYAKQKNCQVLISNHPYFFGCSKDRGIKELPSGDPEPGVMYVFPGDIYKSLTPSGEWISHSDGYNRVTEILETFKPEYTGNQIFNYTKDLDNRLVYFYGDLEYLGWSRPAWYLFLRGLLSGRYQEESDKIVYDSPGKYYSEDGVDLEKYKSNFLSDNGHIFYYRRFFNHPGDWKYTTSVLSRFCMDKVTNTVLREFPGYLGKETSGEIIQGLQGILSRLKQRYPIIYSLDLDYIEEDRQNQSLSVYLNLGIRETLDKDVKLSVTLNFNYN